MNETLETGPRPKKLRVWLYRSIGALVVIIVTFVAFLPKILSSSLFSEKIRNAISENSGGLASLDSYELGWGSFTVHGLRIRNPQEPGMPDEDALSLERASGSLSLWPLLFGHRIELTMQAEAPILRVHRTQNGRSNLEAIQEHMSASVSSDSGDSGDSGADNPVEDSETPPLLLDIQIKGGSFRFTDAKSGVARSIDDLNLIMRNQEAGAPLLVDLRGQIVESKRRDENFSLTATAALDGTPPERIKFQTTGIDLAAWAPLVNSFLSQPFESLKGTVQGDIEAKLERGGEAWKITGLLEMAAPDIAGGLLGQGRGLKAEKWVLSPNFIYDSKTRDTQLEGTRIELGFATITGLSPKRAKEIMTEASKQPGERVVPLGLALTLDLAKLASQKGLLPEGVWSGTLSQELAVLVDPKVSPENLSEVPFRLVGKLSSLSLPQALLPAGAKAPKSVDFRLRGSANPKAASLAPTTATLRCKGIELDSRLSLDPQQSLSADSELRLAPEQAPWLAAFLPSGLQLSGKSILTARIEGSLSDPQRPLHAKGAYSASTISFLGNQLSKLSQEFSWTQGGEISLRMPQPAQLNGGPLAFSASIGSGDTEDLSFKLQWNGGQAAYGLTPILQYALPLLAGLPTNDLQKLSQIDFAATTSLSLSARGPAPGKRQSFQDVLSSWTGNGELKLADGGFTPSSELAKLLQFKGGGAKITFDGVQGSLAIRNGRIHLDDMHIGGKDGKVKIQGSTGLLGDLTQSIDFTDWLAQHRDGKRILAAIGNKPIKAQLTGDLLSPRIEVADFAKKILEGGLKNAVNGLIQGVGSGKKPEKALKDLLRGLKGKK